MSDHSWSILSTNDIVRQVHRYHTSVPLSVWIPSSGDSLALFVWKGVFTELPIILDELVVGVFQCFALPELELPLPELSCELELSKIISNQFYENKKTIFDCKSTIA